MQRTSVIDGLWDAAEIHGQSSTDVFDRVYTMAWSWLKPRLCPDCDAQQMWYGKRSVWRYREYLAAHDLENNCNILGTCTCCERMLWYSRSYSEAQLPLITTTASWLRVTRLNRFIVESKTLEGRRMNLIPGAWIFSLNYNEI
jgi:hypothetical protein